MYLLPYGTPSPQGSHTTPHEAASAGIATSSICDRLGCRLRRFYHAPIMLIERVVPVASVTADGLNAQRDSRTHSSTTGR